MYEAGEIKPPQVMLMAKNHFLLNASKFEIQLWKFQDEMEDQHTSTIDEVFHKQFLLIFYTIYWFFLF